VPFLLVNVSVKTDPCKIIEKGKNKLNLKPCDAISSRTLSHG